MIYKGVGFSSYEKIRKISSDIIPGKDATNFISGALGGILAQSSILS